MEDDNTTTSISEPVAAQADNEAMEDYQDYQSKISEDNQFGSYPGEQQMSSLFSFFRHILGMKDSSKVANLDKQELGRYDLSVRSCQNLAHIAGALHNRSIKEWYISQAEITLATSMSKRGWLPELVVSQKRFSGRAVTPIAPVGQQPKKSFFNFGNKNNAQSQPAQENG